MKRYFRIGSGVFLGALLSAILGALVLNHSCLFVFIRVHSWPKDN